jgi:two-component system sensor histidine kinase DesK
MTRFRLLPPDPHLSWVPYAWLIYLAFYLAYPVFGFFATPSTWETVVAVAGLLVFLPLYFRGFWVAGPELLRIVAAITALAVVMMPINPGASCFFIYAGAFLGDVGPPRVAARYLAAIVALILVEAWAFEVKPQGWVPALLFTPLIGGVNIHFAEVRRSDAKLRRAQEEVEHMAKIAERERIARDLHDLLGHTLSVIVLKSELASKLAARDVDGAVAEIRDVEKISREALFEIRRAIQGYRSFGVREEVENARRALDAAGVSLDTRLAPVRLPAAHEAAVALALREAVTNIVRHASATHCRIELREEGRTAVLEVRDDGVGGGAPDGSGLRGMQERVGIVGGRVVRETNGGTRIRVTVPMDSVPPSAAIA